jgi:hypothetical protein
MTLITPQLCTELSCGHRSDAGLEAAVACTLPAPISGNLRPEDTLECVHGYECQGGSCCVHLQRFLPLHVGPARQSCKVP